MAGFVRPESGQVDRGAVLTGPADAGNIGTWTTHFAANYGSRIALLTQHLYPLGPIADVGATSPDACTISNLLSAATHSKAASEGAQLESTAQSAKVPWRMAESNSCYGGGTGAYTPIAVSGSSVTARPLYDALLLF
jgi:hypothetical protein